MSSNIRITRVCLFCGVDFEAKTTVTLYCSMTCNRKHYKLKIKQEKIGISDLQIKTTKNKVTLELREMEFLTVKNASILLRCNKQTIYNMINSGKLLASNLQVKKTLIKRSEIDKFFNLSEIKPFIETVKLKPKTINIKSCYSVGEAIAVTGMSEKAFTEAVKRNNFQKTQQGRCVYILKRDVHGLINRS